MKDRMTSYEINLYRRTNMRIDEITSNAKYRKDELDKT